MTKRILSVVNYLLVSTSLLTCLAVALLWMRSAQQDQFMGTQHWYDHDAKTDRLRNYAFISGNGLFFLSHLNQVYPQSYGDWSFHNYKPWEFKLRQLHTSSIPFIHRSAPTRLTTMGFDAKSESMQFGQTAWAVQFPHWFFLLVVSATMGLWIYYHRIGFRFTLRTTMVLTALIAGMCGALLAPAVESTMLFKTALVTCALVIPLVLLTCCLLWILLFCDALRKACVGTFRRVVTKPASEGELKVQATEQAVIDCDRE